MRWTLMLGLALGMGCGSKPRDTGSPAEGEGEGEPGTGTAAVDAGECLGSPYRPAEPDTGPYEADPRVEAAVSGSTVTLSLLDVRANCCPTPGATWSLTGSTYNVEFDDTTADTACGCECYMDFTVAISDVAAGTWTFVVAYGEETLGTVTATVEG